MAGAWAGWFVRRPGCGCFEQGIEPDIFVIDLI